MRTLKTSAFALSVLMLSSAAFAQTTVPGATTTNPSETETDAGIVESMTPSNDAPQADGTTGATTGATGATGTAGSMDNNAGAAPENVNPSESEQGASRMQELQQNCPEGQMRPNVGADCMPQ